MEEGCYSCEYVMRERNEITGGYLYFCKKLRKSVLWGQHCGFYKHVILSPEEQKLQDTIDKIVDDIFSQLEINKMEAYDSYMQKKLEEEK